MMAHREATLQIMLKKEMSTSYRLLLFFFFWNVIASSVLKCSSTCWKTVSNKSDLLSMRVSGLKNLYKQRLFRFTTEENGLSAMLLSLPKLKIILKEHL